MKDSLNHNLDQHEKAFQRASVRNSGQEDPAITQRFDIAREVSGANGVSSATDATLNWNSGDIVVAPGGPKDGKPWPSDVSGISGFEKSDRRTEEQRSGVEQILNGRSA